MTEQNEQEIPNVVTFAPNARRKRPVDLAGSVTAAMRHLGEPSKLSVLINDPQRHTASREVLVELLRRIDPAGLRLLVATGAHRIAPAERARFQRQLLKDLPLDPLEWHDARAANLMSIAGQWRGHRWLLADRPLLAIGSVEPHYFAGFTGAHKTASIGCAAHADIEANHAAVLTGRCRPAQLQDNPVHVGIGRMLQALAKQQRLAVVNLVQVGRNILFAAGGEPMATLHAAADVASEVFVRRIDAAADALILEVAGALGGSFYQADKGLKNNAAAVRDGGCLVLLAPCPDGIGQDAFVDLLRQAGTYAEVRELLDRRGYRLGDHKAVLLRRLTDPAARGVKVFLVSEGLTADQARLLGLTKAANLPQALESGGIDPARQKVYHLRDAGNLCVTLGGN